MTEKILKAKELLKKEGVTCAAVTETEIFTSNLMGITPLMQWLSADKNSLNGAAVADKVIGKAAAFLMVYGKVAKVFGTVVSQPAAEVLDTFGISYEAEKIVPHIINRTKDGMCPMEQCVLDINGPEKAFTVLKAAVMQMKSGKI